MKTILVDAINTFVIKEEGVFEEMYGLLESYPNPKIILTGANDEQMKKFGLDKMPYTVFTLKHNPEKTETEYFTRMLQHFNLEAGDVIYFEHNPAAAEVARSLGIETLDYDKDKKDLISLKSFIDSFAL
ncbi:hypothetical protein GOV11_02135 [Candidatus Woesearchaeota archaeon]|nr:hypothetical protein [Candidatus Woesearchaeota archaeon]